MRPAKGFVQFCKEQMAMEAKLLDGAWVTLRIEGTAMIVHEQQKLDGRVLSTSQTPYPTGIDTSRLDEKQI